MGVFTEVEMEKAKDIITFGLLDSAKSLEVFIKLEIKLDLGDDFSISENSSNMNITDKGDEVYLLTSELIGEIKGTSYLILSKEEVKSIMASIYPNNEFTEKKYKKKANALILETDNIITAGVMNNLANIFNYRTYGGVPQLNIVNHNEALRIISGGTKKDDYVFFKAILSSKMGNIKADFIWLLDKAFVEGVKTVSKSRKISLTN
jgi:chemotaxis protein CheY-P-specific phosphatase CheC